MKIIILSLIFILSLLSSPAFAATSVPFTITMNEAVNVTGTPRIAVDVGGVTRYATYASGTGTSSLTFTYAAQAGDVDLDGVTLSSPIDLNGGTITDLNGNPETDLAFTVPNTSGIKIDYPSVSMDFVADADGRYTLNGTAYNDLPSFLTASGGTFSRNSIATYFDATGTLQTAATNTPRFDHDPVTHAAKGILIEESRTNLLLYSEDISNSIWRKDICGGVTNSGTTTTTPKGTLTIIYDFSNNACLYQDVTISSGLNISHSIWIKANKTATIGFRIPGTASVTSNSITVGTTWQRFTATAISDGTLSRLLIDNRAGNGYGVNGLQLAFFGGQIEQGAFPTSYIPTTTGPVIRAADVLTINTGSWYNPAEGTIASWSTQLPLPSMNIRFASINDGTPNNRFLLQKNSATNLRFISIIGGTTVASPTTSSSFTGTSVKVAAAYKANNFGVSVNGTAPATASTGGVPTVTKINISGDAGLEPINSSLTSLKYYPARISNTQLQLMTQ